MILREAGVLRTIYGTGEEQQAPRSPRKLDDHSRAMLDFLEGASDYASAKRLALENYQQGGSSSSSSSSSSAAAGTGAADLPGFASSPHTVSLLAKLAEAAK